MLITAQGLQFFDRLMASYNLGKLNQCIAVKGCSRRIRRDRQRYCNKQHGNEMLCMWQLYTKNQRLILAALLPSSRSNGHSFSWQFNAHKNLSRSISGSKFLPCWVHPPQHSEINQVRLRHGKTEAFDQHSELLAWSFYFTGIIPMCVCVCVYVLLHGFIIT
jgi:hypothetical protein